MHDEIYQGKPLWFTATMADDSSKVFIQFEDKGERVPGWDKDENRYEAFTSWWRLIFPAARGPEGQQMLENYIQLDKFTALTAETGPAWERWVADMEALRAMGVDMCRGLTPATEQDMADLRALMATIFKAPPARPLQPMA